MDDDEPEPKRRKLDPAATKSRKRRFGPVWMIPHLIKSLKVDLENIIIYFTTIFLCEISAVITEPNLISLKIS